MNKDFIEDFQNLVSLDDVTYYYHVTNVNPEDILNYGLYMVGNKIYETAIEIPNEFIDNPIEYVLNERGNIGYRQNASIIIIGVNNDQKDELIKKIDFIPNSWNHDELPEYFIPSDNIIGYRIIA